MGKWFDRIKWKDSTDCFSHDNTDNTDKSIPSVSFVPFVTNEKDLQSPESKAEA